ncbi:MAG: ABC-2 family transporter protein [Blautia sp.]|nr:ABC-2 family transporter protein [Blautia sp.]
MKKYFSFFRLRLVTGLQYRSAALAGIVTQFFWGFMEIMVLRAFYEADPGAYPMTMEETCCYIWLQQAFLAFIQGNVFEPELLNSVTDGGIAYELCRPVSLYDMWFARIMAGRMSRAMLRCLPILGVVVFLPDGYGLTAPVDMPHFIWFVITLFLGGAVFTAMSMILYMVVFYTLSANGIGILFASLRDFLTGAVIPFPFFPQKLQRVLEILPFAAIQNAPLRIYSGNLTGTEMERAVLLQVFWLIVLTILGKVLWRRAEKRVVVQGG